MARRRKPSCACGSGGSDAGDPAGDRRAGAVAKRGHGSSGRSAPGRKVVIPIDGLHCADCALNIERSVRHLSGVLDTTVSYTAKEAVVHYDPYRIDESKIRKAIARPGYVPRDTAVELTQSFLAKNRDVILGALCGAFLIAGWAARWGGLGDVETLWGLGLDDAMFLAAVGVGGYPIVRNALATLMTLQLNVHVLVTTAVGGAIALGHYAEAATVTFIMILGEALEELTVRRSRSALSSVMGATPTTASVVRGGSEIEVPVGSVAVGDAVAVRQGERVPVDGTIVQGETSLNESMITGEWVPADKRTGDPVYSGTLNEGDWFLLKATSVGEDTVVAQIRRLVEEAEETKAPIERVADRFATYFIPVIYAAALAVFLATHDVVRAITILIVACPCALVLATPTAVVAGIGRAAKSGIVIRGGDSFEAAGRVDAVLFDKTGTLTTGNPEVVGTGALGDVSESDVLLAAATAEKRSEHPLARAVVARAAELGLAVDPPESFEVKRGAGVRATAGGRELLVGKLSLLAECGVPITDELARTIAGEEQVGRTAMVVAIDGVAAGFIVVSDTLRDGAAEAVGRLRSDGIGRIAMITGDNERTARAVARVAGIDEVVSDVMPDEKAAKVRELGESGYGVAMVGDGVNDAPALAAAEVGIAMGVRGSDMAVESADIALMTDDLRKVAEAIRMSRRGLSVIKQNIAFALLFNAALVILTSAGYVTMVLGAVLHQLSSTGVVLNSMRLLTGRRDD